MRLENKERKEKKKREKIELEAENIVKVGNRDLTLEERVRLIEIYLFGDEIPNIVRKRMKSMR